MLKKLRKDPVSLVLLAVIGGSLFLSQGNVSETMTSLGDAKKMMVASTAKNNEMLAGQQSDKNQSAIAEQRYKDGCLILLYKGQMAAIAQGRPVYDPLTKFPLPKGTQVCDGYGTTARLEPRDFDGDGVFIPVITQEAFTGNKEVIDNALTNNKRAFYQ
ncbi:hypothetical protein H6G04_30010 [Calothrix membranacea FACHB-236]|nr:hypothetical protein [Calothrix membranacea FACHB-236]